MLNGHKNVDLTSAGRERKREEEDFQVFVHP